jgi:hypothetical protein
VLSLQPVSDEGPSLLQDPDQVAERDANADVRHRGGRLTADDTWNAVDRKSKTPKGFHVVQTPDPLTGCYVKAGELGQVQIGSPRLIVFPSSVMLPTAHRRVCADGRTTNVVYAPWTPGSVASCRSGPCGAVSG